MIFLHYLNVSLLLASSGFLSVEADFILLCRPLSIISLNKHLTKRLEVSKTFQIPFQSLNIRLNHSSRFRSFDCSMSRCFSRVS
jgi:hypothetical protein